MRRFALKIELLVLVLLLVFAHHLGDSRTKRQGDTGFVFDGSGDDSGKSCITKDGGQQGVCIEISKCDEANKIFDNNPTREQIHFLQQRTCKFEGNTPFFCCTSGSSPNPQPIPPPTLGPVSRQMTESDLNEVCGATKILDLRVVGGQPAALGAWPWMAAIYVGPSLSFVSCGGVLINGQYVLTAAHCLIDKVTEQKRKISEFTIRLGQLDDDGVNKDAATVDLSAAELIPHENYNHSTKLNDIAVVKLSQTVSFTDLISPICLPSSPPMSNDLYAGRSAYVAGWGTEEFDGIPSSELQQVMLTVTTNSECETNYTRFKVTIADTQLCASSAGKDACQGDSGGALMFVNPQSDKWFVIGIVSVGFKCAEPGIPGIYSRTTSYIDWIKKNAKIQ